MHAQPKTSYITLEKVSSAVADLKKQGLRVTVRAVRGQIGCGSLSTISNFLKDISSAEESNLSPSDRLTQFPDQLKALMLSIYAETVEAAMSEAAKKRLEIHELEVGLRCRWAANIKEKFRALRRLQIETNNCIELRAELKQVTQKTWNDQEIINSLSVRLSKAESTNEQLFELVEVLKNKNKNCERQIEHFEQQVFQQRRADNQMHLLKVAKLEQDLENSQSRVMELSMALAGMSRDGNNS